MGHRNQQPGSLGICGDGGLRVYQPGAKPTVALKGHHGGADVYGGLPSSVTIPATGPDRRAGVPPCRTALTGRRCGKRVALRYDGGWRCVGCGCSREDVPDA